jgi:hypothetical protein
MDNRVARFCRSLPGRTCWDMQFYLGCLCGRRSLSVRDQRTSLSQRSCHAVAGVLLMVRGLLGLRKFIRLVPHPVMLGSVNG